MIDIAKKQIIERGKYQKVYRCTKPTYELIKGISLEEPLGKILASQGENVEYYFPSYVPPLEDFLLKKAKEEYNKNILILGYQESNNLECVMMARGEVYPKTTHPIEEDNRRRYVSLEQLKIPKYGVPVFHEDMMTLQQITGKKFISVVKNEIIYLETSDPEDSKPGSEIYAKTDWVTAGLLYKILKKYFGEKYMICDFRNKRINDPEMAYGGEYEGVGIIIKEDR